MWHGSRISLCSLSLSPLTLACRVPPHHALKTVAKNMTRQPEKPRTMPGPCWTNRQVEKVRDVDSPPPIAVLLVCLCVFVCVGQRRWTGSALFVCNLGWDIKRCRHRSGRATGCNSVKQPFQYHGLLHRWSQYFRREPANVDPLDRSLELATPSASSSHSW